MLQANCDQQTLPCHWWLNLNLQGVFFQFKMAAPLKWKLVCHSGRDAGCSWTDGGKRQFLWICLLKSDWDLHLTNDFSPDWLISDALFRVLIEMVFPSCSSAPPKRTKTASQLQWICFIFLLQKQTEKLPSRNTGIQEIIWWEYLQLNAWLPTASWMIKTKNELTTCGW